MRSNNPKPGTRNCNLKMVNTDEIMTITSLDGVLSDLCGNTVSVKLDGNDVK